MSAKLFESALGIADPWFIESVKFDEAAKTLTIRFKGPQEGGATGCALRPFLPFKIKTKEIRKNQQMSTLIHSC